MPTQNSRLAGFTCLRCGLALPVADHVEGCPDCLRAGYPSSVRPVYDGHPARLADPRAQGCRRYADWLAYADWPSLGEGGTPLVDLPGLAAELGLGSLAVKNEGANPTGSHKDRMSMLFVARALATGARTVVAASSGNAGASVAAYAARAGLDCVIVTMPEMSPNWRRAIEMHGARLVAAPDAAGRWPYVQRRVREDGWVAATNYLNPPVGSAPFGVDGYRTVAFELAEACGPDGLDHVVVPTARADLLWGIARGFADLVEAGLATRVPKVHAAEPFPRLSRVLEGADYRTEFPGGTAQSSIAGGTVTFQALDALRLCGGTAVAVGDVEVAADRQSLARAGLYTELSSAAGLSAVRTLRKRGTVEPGQRVVLIATSHGYKELAPEAGPIAPIG